jgi:predicted transcriptional regulator of viral defense system
MPKPTRLTIAKRDIFAAFETRRGTVLTRSDIAAILSEQREFWRLAQRTTVDEFIHFLRRDGKLELHQLTSPDYKSIMRFSWGEVSPLLIGLSIRNQAYFSHGTATWLHGLTNLVPKHFVLNAEQSAKPRQTGTLSQEAVNKAFSRKPRRSNLIYSLEEMSFTVLSGKATGRLGVEALVGPDGETVEATNLERTLIDIVVRPSYAGGITEVLDCYRRAEPRASANKIVALLKNLDYIYPYHQAIGFLMEAAGFKPERLARIEAEPRNIDFYLEHNIQRAAYSSKWRLFFPESIASLVSPG